MKAAAPSVKVADQVCRSGLGGHGPLASGAVRPVESGPHRRRLYRPRDPYDPAREGARALPEASELPAEYRDLLTWYRRSYARAVVGKPSDDPLLALRGSGRALWADEPADAYIQRLREGWA